MTVFSIVFFNPYKAIYDWSKYIDNLRYPTGEGSSYQHVVGCGDVDDVEQDLWQIVIHVFDDVRLSSTA